MEGHGGIGLLLVQLLLMLAPIFIPLSLVLAGALFATALMRYSRALIVGGFLMLAAPWVLLLLVDLTAFGPLIDTALQEKDAGRFAALSPAMAAVMAVTLLGRRMFRR